MCSTLSFAVQVQKKDIPSDLHNNDEVLTLNMPNFE